MDIGQLFNITGYDIAATAQCDHGTVLVLNNNSSHYLVAETEQGGEDLDGQGKHTVLYNPQARLAGSYCYGRDGGILLYSARECYEKALRQMAEVALRNTSDEPTAADYYAASGDDVDACPTV